MSDAIREAVRDALARVKPLAGNGPNRFTVSVPGWHLSAPSRKQLSLMLWHWFTFECDSDRYREADETQRGSVLEGDRARAVGIAHPFSSKDSVS